MQVSMIKKMYQALFFCLFGMVLMGCSSDQQVPAGAPTESFKVITKGEPVALTQHVVAGKVTVFDFYADWCPPCKKLDRSLAGMKKTYGNRLEILKLDLVSFDSALAKDQEIRDLPYLVVYDEEQNLLARGESVHVLPKLLAHLNR